MGWTQIRGSKFGAKRTVTGGRQYDSKKEAGYSQRLTLLKQTGWITDWTPQVTLQLFSYGKKICRYRMDFVVTKTDGTIEFHEVKGFATPVWELKWKLLEACINTKDFRDYNKYSMDADLQMILIK